MNPFREYALFSEHRLPRVIEPGRERQLSAFIEAHSEAVQERLIEHGAVLFRGFNVRDVPDFDAFVGAVSQRRIDYVYGSTPRTALGNRIFTATEYPESLEIPLHNENSYQRTWPLKLALCCLVPAASEGETPIADMRRVDAALGPALLDKFEQKQIRYVRHYRPYVDVPWQQVFQTDDRNELARFCSEHHIEHEWLDTETLRTSQTCQGVAYHPTLGRRVFFNQAHLFHSSSVGAKAAQALAAMYGALVPRQTFFGDGSEIPTADLESVRNAFNEAKLIFPWRAGDVLLLDNMQVAHGRRPFKGPRRVVAALLESHSDL